ncbi:MAG: helix-turn-helix domain-containing protein [Acidobacteriota bacterium]
MQEAPDKASYQRRLAVWLTYLGPFPAGEVAAMLGVSKQAVWKWISEYNKRGPDGLDREGRGGRRWGLLSEEQEKAVLERFAARARSGDIVSAKQLLPEICKAVGREVSLAYVYKLLHRQQWRKLAPRPRHVNQDPAAQAAFKQTSRRRSG